jgi:hypothetical protein
MHPGKLILRTIKAPYHVKTPYGEDRVQTQQHVQCKAPKCTKHCKLLWWQVKQASADR